MKKVFMEPEVKVTKFEYEDIMNVDITSSPEVVGPEVDPEKEDLPYRVQWPQCAWGSVHLPLMEVDLE